MNLSELHLDAFMIVYRAILTICGCRVQYFLVLLAEVDRGFDQTPKRNLNPFMLISHPLDFSLVVWQHVVFLCIFETWAACYIRTVLHCCHVVG